MGDRGLRRPAPEESRTDEQRAALALAATLTDELVAADALLFAVPLYNFGVSQHFKTWVDMVITDPRMAAGAQPVLAGKPAVLVTVRGGNYRPGTPREGWDHATGWMRRILADVWHLDLKVVEAEFTIVGVNPALDQFTDLARQLRQEAEEQARRHGRELGAARHERDGRLKPARALTRQTEGDTMSIPVSTCACSLRCRRRAARP